ncbi:adenylyltransferase/cytidyltransferase family protein [Kordiimonas sp. SCSIO 12603]|uniref:adenylyltransferase/cytidyltransferase family protein n=1 Tax=Kordiimonas sp. SCSIO 12603 TaxID=2829596 RepID=UPI0021080FFC|nr:adenylyltransferase/cytidyltransferase family protein [Kordiimonas sp. SCSIO 12603]UTW58953.1 adenylyltransferase/cytidyltransferase family protein [Kordiimonas sp. SCSIO 12603]
MIIGYTTGVFDLFHVGHVRILKNASALCDKLIVGVTSDEMVYEYKKKKTVIPFNERLEIVSSCKYVDVATIQENHDKLEAWNRYHFDIMFVGDDWFKTCKWRKIEEELKTRNVRTIYFPYTKTTSSTLINQTLEDLRDN